MPGGEFDWGGRLRYQAPKVPQNGRKPFEECKEQKGLTATPTGGAGTKSRA